MKQIIYYVALLAVISSCATQKPLYTWAGYEDASYDFLKKSDEKATQTLIENYKKVIAKQKGTRGVVPPGVYADYGFILIQNNKIEEGSAMLEKEMTLYPESQVFIKRILNMIKK